VNKVLLAFLVRMALMAQQALPALLAQPEQLVLLATLVQ